MTLARLSMPVLALTLSFPGVLPAETRSESGKPTSGYNPAVEMTLRGTIQQVARHSVEGMAEIHLIVSTGDRTVEVHLGPRQFVLLHQFQFHAGDTVEITAAQAKGEPHYLARLVKCGWRTLALRDERGFPLWKSNPNQ